ncbi:MAG: S8/S53 family peptidase [Actinomycetota bacterium]|nr:S8/S53 family peptidase [Actinomycetota bacterium]
MSARSGQPSGSSYGPADPRSYEERLADLHTIYDQVCNINSRQGDSAVGDDLIRQLQERRAETDLVQFDPVADARGDMVLVVRGELLIRAEALEDHGPLIAAYCAQTHYVECLDNRLVRLVVSDTGGSQLIQLAGTLRARGVAVSMNDVATTGAVIKKGFGSPEPSAAKQQPSLPPPGDGEPIRVAVIDTGIADQQRSDGWLTGLVRSDNVDPLDELPSPNGFLDLGAGHGTFVAGVIQQVAPGAEIAVYRGLDSDGAGSMADTACAMVRAVRQGAQILNLSFGLEALDDQPPVALEVALEIINEIAAETGREAPLIVAAAGNFGRARPVFPAAFPFPNVVAVAGLTQGFAPAQWSSRGSWVDCSTLGEGIWSTYVKGSESPIIDPKPDKFGDDAWALWTGTSFAAPQIAGAVAKVAQEHELTPRDALEKVLDGGSKIPGYGRAVEILPPT